ncbi:tail assembly protein [Escherichia coli]|nr:tail assembly protein [Escherichia coli]
MAATHTLPLASPGMARICLYGDLQRFGRRIDLRVKTGAEAIRALATQLPAFLFWGIYGTEIGPR